MPNDAESSDRLDSWKDIAGYLRRDVSTVQRWEKREGMPVHRHLHERLGSVYAFRSELDVWSKSRGLVEVQETAADSIAQEPEPLDRPGAAQTAPARWRAAAAMGALAVIIAIALAVTFTRSAGRATDSSGITTTGSAEAQELVLRARYLSDRTTNSDNQSAIALLERAIVVDPTFARAYAELGSAYVTRLAYVTPDETRELEEKSYSAAEKAFALDPNLPEVYLARGDLLWTHSHRFAHERAIQEFRRALSLNPKSAQAHRRIARVLVHVGFFEEGRQHADSALAANPTDSQALNSRAQSLLWSGRSEEALAILLSIPGPVLPELVEANTVFALHGLGRRDEALGYLQKALQKYPDDPSGNLRGIQALLLSESDPGRAEALIDGVRQRKTANPSHHAAYFAGCASARLRKASEAVQWLKEAAASGFPCYSLFARDPNLDPIRSDAGFQAFMSELQKQSTSLRLALFPVK
jgi:tetratricopeptide (TPR) repeat protein